MADNSSYPHEKAESIGVALSRNQSSSDPTETGSGMKNGMSVEEQDLGAETMNSSAIQIEEEQIVSRERAFFNKYSAVFYGFIWMVMTGCESHSPLLQRTTANGMLQMVGCRPRSSPI
jgi:hypothetical protein